MIGVHELGMCEAVLETVERRAAGRQVSSVRLRIGTLHRVDPSALDQAFTLVAAGTVADGAAVELVNVPVRLSCRACGDQTKTDQQAEACPACGAFDIELDGGDELTLESLELATVSSPSDPPS